MEQFKTIKETTTAELIEKKSKFIAHVFYVEHVEEVENKLKEAKANNIGAKHYCYAYRIVDNGQILEKSSDDRRTFTVQQEHQC